MKNTKKALFCDSLYPPPIKKLMNNIGFIITAKERFMYNCIIVILFTYVFLN
jgi:hypothetical protein